MRKVGIYYGISSALSMLLGLSAEVNVETSSVLVSARLVFIPCRLHTIYTCSVLYSICCIITFHVSPAYLLFAAVSIV